MDTLNLQHTDLRIPTQNWEYFQKSILTELTNRTILYCSPGIISEDAAIDSEDARPSVDQLSGYVNVTAGYILFKSGLIGLLGATTITEVPDANLLPPNSKEEYWITARPLYEGTTPQVVRNKQILTRKVFSIEVSLEKVLDFSFTSADSVEVLGKLTISRDAEGIPETPLITFPTEYPIRNWSTSSDKEHISKVGTGTISATNPHGMSLGDLDITQGIYIWGVSLNDGVATKNRDAHYAGTGKEYTIPSTSLQYHQNGSTHVFTLKDSAICIEYISKSFADPETEGHGDLIEKFEYNSRLNKLTVYGIDSVGGYGLIIRYTTVDAGRVGPLVQDTVNTIGEVKLAPFTIVCNGATDKEFCIVGGREVTPQYKEFNLSSQLSFPMDYSVYLGSDGVPYLDPYVLMAPVNVLTLNTETELNLTLAKPSILRIGAYHDVATGGSILVRIKGFNTKGEEIDEVYTLENWAVGSVGYSHEQYIDTPQTYSSVTSVTITGVAETVDPSTVVTILATTEGITDLLLGEAVTKLRDGFFRAPTEISPFTDHRTIHVLPVGNNKQMNAPNTYFTENFQFAKCMNPLASSWSEDSYILEGGVYASYPINTSTITKEVNLNLVVAPGMILEPVVKIKTETGYTTLTPQPYAQSGETQMLTYYVGSTGASLEVEIHTGIHNDSETDPAKYKYSRTKVYGFSLTKA